MSLIVCLRVCVCVSVCVCFNLLLKPERQKITIAGISLKMLKTGLYMAAISLPPSSSLSLTHSLTDAAPCSVCVCVCVNVYVVSLCHKLV